MHRVDLDINANKKNTMICQTENFTVIGIGIGIYLPSFRFTSFSLVPSIWATGTKCGLVGLRFSTVANSRILE